MKAPLALTAVVAVVLAIGASSALAEGRLAGSPGADSAAYFRANELRTAAAAGQGRDAVAFFHANELATAAHPQGTAGYRDAHERAEPVASPEVSPRATSGGVSFGGWSLVGIALGIGLALTLGLLLTVRTRPSRPVAQ